MKKLLERVKFTMYEVDRYVAENYSHSKDEKEVWISNIVNFFAPNCDSVAKDVGNRRVAREDIDVIKQYGFGDENIGYRLEAYVQDEDGMNDVSYSSRPIGPHVEYSFTTPTFVNAQKNDDLLQRGEYLPAFAVSNDYMEAINVRLIEKDML